MALIEFFVPGRPATAGSKRGFYLKKQKRMIMAPDNKRKELWSAEVKNRALDAWQSDVLFGPLELELTFFIPRPQGHFGTGRNAGKVKSSAPIYSDKQPDLTKYLRCIEDALTGILWANDGQIAVQYNKKLYVNSGERIGVAITVKPLENVRRDEPRG